MTNQTQTSWEQAILNKLTNNGERLAIVEKDISQIKEYSKDIKNRLSNIEEIITQIKSLLGWLKWIGGGVIAIALSLIANFVYSFFST
jgi:hypothetical protein